MPKIVLIIIAETVLHRFCWTLVCIVFPLFYIIVDKIFPQILDMRFQIELTSEHVTKYFR